jgi:hypothetical protein
VSRFKAGDIVVNREGFSSPLAILGEHTFPDGGLAYRNRGCLPQYDMETGKELWINKDGYLLQEFVDNNYELLWRNRE